MSLHAHFRRRAEEAPVQFEWRAPSEALPSWAGSPLSRPNIDPTLSDAPLPPASSTHTPHEHIVCYDPSTAFYLGTYPATLRTEIDVMIQGALEAQMQWAKTTWPQRRRLLNSLLNWVVNDMEAICRVAARDTGKTMIDAAFGEILPTSEKLRWCIANVQKVLEADARPTNLILLHKRSVVHYEPLGVVAAIISWNYPLHSLLSTVIAALAGGNAIIVKVSENVVWSSHHYLSAIHSCLRACGYAYAEDLVQIAACLPEGSKYLSSAKGIKHITFIGSDIVGRQIAAQASTSCIPCTLELGGKDPAIILPDADINFFTNHFMRAAFQAAGQNCIGIERFIVAAPLYERFLCAVAHRVAALKQGSSLSSPPGTQVDVGAMVSDRQFANLKGLLDDAMAKGARIIVGGKQCFNPDFPTAHYWEPTLLADVTPDMEIASQEVFAPIMTVMRFRNIDEAVAIANGTRYGLGAAVFGRSKKRCREAASRLQCGMVAINDFAVFYMNQGMPFGGAKSSGYGRIAGPEGLRALCNVKTVTEDKFHGLVQTSIPGLLAYPIDEATKAWRFVEGLVGMAYGVGWRARANGLGKLVRP